MNKESAEYTESRRGSHRKYPDFPLISAYAFRVFRGFYLPVSKLSAIALLCFTALAAFAHPLGNFTVNHYARIAAAPERLQIRYVVDLAEIPTFQEARLADTDGDGRLSQAELNAYLSRVAPGYIDGLRLTADDQTVVLSVSGQSITLVPGTADLPTMRLVFDLAGTAETINPDARFRFENNNGRDRAGWYELVVVPLAGATVFDSTIYGNSVTDELKAYPEDLLMAPLAERAGEWRVRRGAIPEGAQPLKLRDGRAVAAVRDRFAELIATPQLTVSVALLGVLIAFFLGAGHALTPGHSKALVGAYLIGSRGTVKHAVFLGLTVTITHVSSAYALSLLLIGFSFLAPEQLQIIPAIISSLVILGMGLTLFVRRLRAAIVGAPYSHHHHDHDHGKEIHDHHEHGHSHLPPGADGERVTWRSLLALGVSGGLLPCPSAILVVLAANALGRNLYGLLLVTAFSLGLAGVLTGIGIVFIKAGGFLNMSSQTGRLGRVLKALPVASAAFIAGIGALMLYQALDSAGVNAASLFGEPQSFGESAGTVSVLSVLGVGLVLGLKHAIEADHLAAISAIVSERRSLLSSSLVGGLWGLGHTIALLIAGIIVILLKVQIPERVALGLEFCVAIMLIGLGINALIKVRRGARLHFHTHRHGNLVHAHPHLHEPDEADHIHSAQSRTHHGVNAGVRPLLVGLMHGMAGSAALMLLVIPTIHSSALALVYIAVFGIGSIGGMMAMSTLLGLPLHLTAQRFRRAHIAVSALAALFSLGFGLFLAYEIGFVEGLLR